MCHHLAKLYNAQRVRLSIYTYHCLYLFLSLIKLLCVVCIYPVIISIRFTANTLVVICLIFGSCDMMYDKLRSVFHLYVDCMNMVAGIEFAVVVADPIYIFRFPPESCRKLHEIGLLCQILCVWLVHQSIPNPFHLLLFINYA